MRGLEEILDKEFSKETNQKIYVTLKNANTNLLYEKFLNLKKYVREYSLKGIRINLKDFEDINNYMMILNNILPLKEEVPVLLDLPYPYEKVRGRLHKKLKLDLNVGDEVILVDTPPNSSFDKNTIFFSHEGLESLQKCGKWLFFGDGKGVFKCLEKKEDLIRVEACYSQTFYNTHSFIGSSIPVKDSMNVFFEALNVGVHPELIALSFVKTAKDIKDFREKIHFDTQIFAKIETLDAINNINDILAVADGIMLARGDLAFDIPLKKFYYIQEKVISECQRVGKPLIVATDILSSLEYRGFPSRSDIIDFENIYSRVQGCILTSNIADCHLKLALQYINSMV